MDHAEVMHVRNFATEIQSSGLIGRAIKAKELAGLAIKMAVDFLGEKNLYAATPKLLIEVSRARLAICEAMDFKLPQGQQSLTELVEALVARTREIIDGRELLSTKIKRDAEDHEKDKQQLRVQIDGLKAELRQMTKMKDSYAESTTSARQAAAKAENEAEEIAINVTDMAREMTGEANRSRDFIMALGDRILGQHEALAEKARKKRPVGEDLPF